MFKVNSFKKSKLEQGIVSPLSLQLSKIIRERVKRDKDRNGRRRGAGEEVGREVKREWRIHSKKSQGKTCFKKEGMVKAPIAAEKLRIRIKTVTQLNSLEVTGMYFDRTGSVMDEWGERSQDEFGDIDGEMVTAINVVTPFKEFGRKSKR